MKLAFDEGPVTDFKIVYRLAYKVLRRRSCGDIVN